MASRSFVLAGFPGVFLHAGALHDFHFPACGCDACDDDVLSLADELEWTVRTVVGGGYSERFDPWPGRWVEYRLDEPDVAMRSGRSRVADFPADRVKLARDLVPRSGIWARWPRRS